MLCLVLVACSASTGVDKSTKDAPPAADGRSVAQAEPKMPPLTPALENMRSFYRFHFLPDGYPGRLDDDGRVFAHPIYGTYILSDYLSQFGKTPTPELKAAIRKVANATIKRMDEFHGALVFWYQPEPERGARLYKKHYSGLTQGYYAVQLERAGQALDDAALKSAAKRAFDSLLIPDEDGGVYYDTRFGPVIAEVPQEPNSWILNGWQSALASAHKYALASKSPAAKKLVAESAKAMSRVLPLYDAPSVSNSRYGLTGFVYTRLIFGDKPTSVRKVQLEIPGEDVVDIPRGSGTRWQPYVVPVSVDAEGKPKSRTVDMNAVVSLASSPEPNRLEAQVDVAKETTVRLEAKLGVFDPLSSAPMEVEWTTIGRSKVAAGKSQISFDIGMDVVERVVAPTNFAKLINGEQVNVYHSIHINRLRELAAITGINDLGKWADKFSGYICDWSKNDLYDGLKTPDPTSGDNVDPALMC